MSYQFNVGITVFNSDSKWNTSSYISEFKQFVESNSKFGLNIISNVYEDLLSNEYTICPYSTWNGSAVTIDSLNSTHKGKLPSNVAIQMILYNSSSGPCAGGWTWSYQPVPFSSLGLYWNDSSNYWSSPYAQRLTHEWLNGLYSIFHNNFGFSQAVSPEACGAELKYTYDTSHGWKDCYQYIFNQITDEMYNKIAQSSCKIPLCKLVVQ